MGMQPTFRGLLIVLDKFGLHDAGFENLNLCVAISRACQSVLDVIIQNEVHRRLFFAGPEAVMSSINWLDCWTRNRKYPSLARLLTYDLALRRLWTTLHVLSSQRSIFAATRNSRFSPVHQLFRCSETRPDDNREPMFLKVVYLHEAKPQRSIARGRNFI